MRAGLDRREIDGTYRVGGEVLTFEEDEIPEGAQDTREPSDPEQAEAADAKEPAVGDEADEMGWPTPHILRHTRATLMLRAGVSVQETADYLGMTPAMVNKVYGHTASEYQRRAAAA